jgi:glutathione reductase (NADPH)
MAHYDYDLFVIGAGSAGMRTARMASNHGVRVAIAEQRYLGGTCVNVGCVPKKLLVYAAQFSDHFQVATGFGWTVGNSTFNWSSLIANKDQEIGRLQAVYGNNLQQAGAEVVTGKAKLLDAHTVVVDTKNYSGKQHAVTSNEMFFLDKLPKSIVIVGGGYIAVEFASIVHGLGVQTTLCYRGHRLLRGFDDDIRDFLTAQMSRKGIHILLNTDIEAIEKNAHGYAVRLVGERKINTDSVMYATGRTPNSTGLGLEALGVEFNDDGAIKVNADYQTTVPSIYALGDVTNRVNLTPVALAEGVALVDKLYGDQSKSVDYDNIPTAVFCQPSIGTVGLTEDQARERYTDIDVYKNRFTPMKNTLSGIEEKALVKMIVARGSGRVVGLHIVGPDAPEIIQGMAVAIRAGATKAVFDATIGVHPTAAEEVVTLR